jgi:hypothetical protein
MSVTFTKLFSSITESTVWCEPDPVRLAWICMLAMSDRKGRVFASIPGLANRARISVEAAEDAIRRFTSPDPYSRTPDHEGRRIEPIDGGWRLLNHQKYRELRDTEARKEYQREWKRSRHDVSKVDHSRPQSTHAEADAYTDTEEDLREDSRTEFNASSQHLNTDSTTSTAPNGLAGCNDASPESKQEFKRRLKATASEPTGRRRT